MGYKNKKVIIIGGGGAGLVAAWRAAVSGATVVLFERNKKLGIKLLISGGGKCNITHAGEMEEVRAAFIPHEARFLKPSFYRFTNEDMLQLLESRGVHSITRENGRVFPASGRASDVVDVLEYYNRSVGVDIRLNARVESISSANGVVTGVVVNGVTIPADHVVLATGGVSYPRTGTTGDGYQWAEALGHRVVPLRPSLAPIGIRPMLPIEWRGIALREGCLSVISGGKRSFEWKDDILFTHEGISGPAALEVSRVAAELRESGKPELRFDFFPEKEFIELDAELNQVILTHRGKQIATLLEAWLPNRMVGFLLRSIKVDPEKRGHVLTRDERRAIVRLLKEWKIGDVSHVNIERGEVTAGGVALDEVDPKTMRSRKIKGLYLCGEILDIAGPVGGYNLQAAFSTGYVAGETAASDWISNGNSVSSVESSAAL
ncbi:MAG: NAD(P)/FAD-dependent oxidoreductase [Bacteroidota bacterium]